LLGLNSGRWPRGAAENPLLPDHVIPRHELNPLPAADLDRATFEAIRNGTASELVLSYARRGGEGRPLGRSVLLRDYPVTGDRVLQRNAAPPHAMSETDRLLARPAEFAASERAIATAACWRNWQADEVTQHDGL